MPHPWQNKLKEAERALIHDQLDDARGLLADSHLRRTAAGKVLADRVVARIAARAHSRARRGDTSAGWRDLNQARELSPDAPALHESREAMISLALGEVEKSLRNMDPSAALARLNKLHQRNVAGGRVATLRQVALKAQRAERLMEVGKFEEAARQWTAAQKLREDMNVLADHASACVVKAAEGQNLIDQLRNAMKTHEWDIALDAANRLLEMAPQHPLAREAREEAWTEFSAGLTESQRKRRTAPWRRANPARHNNQTPLARQRLAETLAVTGVGKCENRRLQLWIDAVGGYLVCLGEEVVLGQAIPGASVDVPIFGNLSRGHATIRRDGEGYVLTPESEVRIEGRKLDGPSFLADGDEIQLGEAVRYRFRRPHALSASARLEPLSGHRTHPASDAVLLMAESLVLGRKLHNHVVCRDWEEDVVLFRQGEELHCRCGGDFEIDGHLQDDQGRLGAVSHVCGEDFSLSVEEI